MSGKWSSTGFYINLPLTVPVYFVIMAVNTPKKIPMKRPPKLTMKKETKPFTTYDTIRERA